MKIRNTKELYFSKAVFPCTCTCQNTMKKMNKYEIKENKMQKQSGLSGSQACSRVGKKEMEEINLK